MASSTLPTGENHSISLEQAIEMTSRCRAQKENILGAGFQNQKVVFTCETFNRAAFDRLLNQAGCAGIRIYSAMGNDMRLRVIAVGVNENNEDMLPNPAAMGDNGNNVVEEGQLCPDFCPPSSVLNGLQ